MIILRRPQAPSPIILLAEEPLGTKDGVNQTYETQYVYRPGRIEVIYNGQVLHSPDDFDETSSQGFIFNQIAPDSSDELRVNYEVDACNADPANHSDLPHFFTQLVDTPSNYNTSGGLYVKVKEDRSGLEFVADTTRAGTSFLSVGVTSVIVTFDDPLASASYALTVTLENTVDVAPLFYSTTTISRASTGFEVAFSGAMDSNNYILNWQAIPV